MLDVIETLVADHRTVDQYFDRFAAETDAGRRTEILRDIVRELSVHAALEEQIVYPTMREVLSEGDAAADSSIDEHQQVKRLLADLEKLQVGSSEFADRFEGLLAAVQEHVAEEEGELFPQLRAHLDAERLERLGQLVDRARGLMPTHPHPNVPGTAMAQLLTAPLAGMVDHVRDFVGDLRNRS
jgi:hemerythrin superfamily protein